MHAVESCSPAPEATGTLVFSPERLDALRQAHLLDTEPEEAFDRISRLVTRLTGAPTSTVTLVDRQRQFFKSIATDESPWLAGRETPLAYSFCRHVVEEQAPFRVCDARLDDRVCDNPAIEAYGVVAYLGVPLLAPTGEILGSLCAIDNEPRAWTDEDEESLLDLAAVLTDEIERGETVRQLLAEEHAHADERALTRSGFNAIDDVFYVLDTQNQLVRWNERLKAVTGYDDEELRGMKPEELFASGDGLDVYAAMAEAYQEGHAMVAATVVTKHGARIAYEINGAVFHGGDGQVAGLCGTGRDITDRKRAEEALRLSEARHRGLVEASPDLFLRLSRDGRYLDVRAPDPLLLAQEEALLLTQTISDVLPAPLAARLLGVIESALGTSEPCDVEYELVTQDGADRLFEARVIPVGDEEVQVMVRDITEHKAAERAIRESEVRFRSFVEATTQVVWQADATGSVTELSHAWAEFTGQTPEEIEGWGWGAAVHPDDVDQVVEEWGAAIANRGPYVAEYRVRRRDGVYHRFSTRAVPVSSEGEFLGWVGTCSDVEELRQAEESSQRQEEDLIQRERLLQAIASAHTSLLGDDLDRAVADAFGALGEVTDADRVYLFEMHKEPQTGAALFSQRFEWTRGGVETQVNNPDLQDCPMVEAGFSRWVRELSQGRPVSGPIRTFPLSEQSLLREQGVESLLVAPIRIGGATWGFVGFDDCRTERVWSPVEQATLSAAASSVGEAVLRQRQRAALAESEQRLRLALDSARMGAWETDLQTGAVTISSRTLALFGLPEEGVYDSPFWNEAILDADREAFQAARAGAIRRAQQKGSSRYLSEYRALRGDGVVRWFRSVGHVQTDAKGQPRQITGTVQDVTDEKVYAEALLDAKEAAELARSRAEETARMKSVLLANMSHEIRTPLTSIIGFADLLACEVTGEHEEFVERIVAGGRRLMNTLTSVLDLAQMEAGRRELSLAPVDAQEVVAGAADLFRSQAEVKGLSFVVSQSEDAAVVLGEEAALHRVIANLVSNAIKFTETGHVSLSTSVASGAVTIRVEDSGVGIADTFVPVLFEEFRQESEGESRRFEGNGLGLAISKRLTEMMGGTIRVESEKEVGSTFVVRIPLAA